MTPNVLVISNECFSHTSSNGRTLGNFMVGWPKDKLAQFYLTGKPDVFYCENFFHVSDRQAVNALIGKADKGGRISAEDLNTAGMETASASPAGKKTARNALTMLGRDAIWRSGAWEKSGYWKWVEAFQPDVVLFQAGDCAFMYRMAAETARRLEAKLVIYNSEGYYYKDFDYFRGRGLAHMAYPFFQRQLKKSLERAYADASCVIYICDELREQYAQDFSGRAETVFTGSDIQYEEKTHSNDAFTTVYCGNLGLKRHESLIEIADTLQSISQDLFVDVYGKAPNGQVEAQLSQCRGIRYHGLVPYEQVKQLLRDSDLLLYVESFDAFYQEDIKFGFSTKIADSLASGNCFLLYAPEHFACYQYLRRNQAAYTASQPQELKAVLQELIENPSARCRYTQTALKLAQRNHRIESSTHKFQNILRELAE